MIDNYDSFTYNLVQYLGELGEELKVVRNDKIDISQIERLRPERIVISPGPCTPKEAGISVDVIKHFAGRIPILGVCLGHQSIGYAFGGEIVKAKKLMHGKTSMIYHDNKTIFKDLPNPFEATRYHSLIIKRETIPECLEITAETIESPPPWPPPSRGRGLIEGGFSEEKEIMGVRHKEYLIEGVQFHPESILTKVGKDLLRNFLEL
jgi:anthranilate synthase/aminodeoxychorismate synthase-like glutamine amidotransferase